MEQCLHLKRIILDTLLPIIKSDYIYLDLPYHSNIGDSLIWLGTEYMLKQIPYKCLGKHSKETFTFNKLPSNCVILMHGGGNFGDLWREHQDFRLKVINTYPNNPIIVLPQTVYYADNINILNDASLMCQHKNLTICARDKHSYDLLLKYKFASKVLMLPDMAFCIDSTDLQNKKGSVEKELLIVLRQDVEFPQKYLQDVSVFSHADYKDWPDMEASGNNLWRYMQEHSKEDIDKYVQEVYFNNRIEEGIQFVSKYKKIYSTRLHVAILCSLLDIPVTLLDNSYSKNHHFFETWFMDVEGINVEKEDEKREISLALSLYRIMQESHKVNVELEQEVSLLENTNLDLIQKISLLEKVNTEANKQICILKSRNKKMLISLCILWGVFFLGLTYFSIFFFLKIYNIS